MESTKVVHCKRDSFDIYIGRPSIFGNPFSHVEKSSSKYKVASREEAVSKYEEYILKNITLLSHLKQIKGKTLGCWCSPLACHGHVIAKLADLPKLPDYCLLLYQLLQARALGLEAVEDKILDEMDVVWYALNNEEHDYVKKICESINGGVVHNSSVSSGIVNNETSQSGEENSTLQVLE